MPRIFKHFAVTDTASLKSNLLSFAAGFDVCAVLDNNNYSDQYHSQEVLMAAGIRRSIELTTGNAFQQLRSFYEEEKDWLFGHLSYDLKNETEQLQSSHIDHIRFPDLHFFVPELIVQLNEKEISIGSFNDDHDNLFQQILHQAGKNGQLSSVNIKSRIGKEEYISIIEHLREHILRGDCYEINFCQEFFAEQSVINPLTVYRELTRLSPNPFSCFYKLNDKYLLCASPERYLKKKGIRLLSQPIKGTWSRDLLNADEDEYNRHQLYHNSKERSENVMVVDLVRNDLSRVCKEGSVKVDELFGIYSFPQVHQMISTISGELRNDLHFTDAIKATFPMGSMTGAPKKRVMELIEQYEKTKRGLFSGAVGYIDPAGDFDLNVVIRSIFYNASTQYLSYQVGSAITFYSDAEKEYEECLLKAKAIQNVLGNSLEGAGKTSKK